MIQQPFTGRGNNAFRAQAPGEGSRTTVEAGDLPEPLFVLIQDHGRFTVDTPPYGRIQKGRGWK